jgi:GTP-binding protein
MQKLPVVALIGRVNAGKSTLFNRIIGKPLSVVSERPGVTRDRIRKKVNFDGFGFEVLDTGGLFPDVEDEIWTNVRRHIEKAVLEANVVVLVVDLKAGLTPFDQEVAQWLRKLDKRVILAGNKADVKKKDPAEFFALGLGEILPISAEHNDGVIALLELVTEALVEMGFEPSEVDRKPKKIRVSILGKPNVGKSTLLNALAGEEAVVTSSIPGTTRDAVDVETDEFVFIDTAGIKRRYKDELEYFSSVRTMRSLSYAEVAVVTLDVTQPISRMDKRIVNLIWNEGRGAVIAINKTDLLVREDREAVLADAMNELSFAGHIPKVFISALKGEGIAHLGQVIKNVRTEWETRAKKADLRELLLEIVDAHSPPGTIFSLKQVRVRPPAFMIASKRPLPDHYVVFIERRIRERFGFTGVPIRFKFEHRRR